MIKHLQDHVLLDWRSSVTKPDNKQPEDYPHGMHFVSGIYWEIYLPPESTSHKYEDKRPKSDQFFVSMRAGFMLSSLKLSISFDYTLMCKPILCKKGSTAHEIQCALTKSDTIQDYSSTWTTILVLKNKSFPSSTCLSLSDRRSRKEDLTEDPCRQCMERVYKCSSFLFMFHEIETVSIGQIREMLKPWKEMTSRVASLA